MICYVFFFIRRDFFFSGAPKLNVFTTFYAAALLPIRIGLLGGDFFLNRRDFFRFGLLVDETVSLTSLSVIYGLGFYLMG